MLPHAVVQVVDLLDAWAAWLSLCAVGLGMLAMTINFDEERLDLKQAASLVGVHLSTIWRWALNGVKGRRLPTMRIGGRRFVLRRSLEDFVATDADKGSSGSELPISSRRRADLAAEQLKEELDL